MADDKPGDFAVRLADAIGLPLDRLQGYTLRCWAGKLTLVRATYYVPSATGLEGKRIVRRFQVTPIDAGGRPAKPEEAA